MTALAHASHHWDGASGHGWMWLWGTLMMLVVVAAVAVSVLLVARSVQRTASPPSDRAREILAERYARGELTTDEYRERLHTLG